MRTTCARTPAATLAVGGAAPVPAPFHHLRGNGTVVVAVPQDSTATALAWHAGTAGLPAMIELADQSPLPLREPFRALVWLRGTLTTVDQRLQRAVATELSAENPSAHLLDVGHSLTLLRLHVDSAVLADSAGAAPTCRAELLAATPDPFWESEAQWLAHLDSAHPDLLTLIAQRLPHPVRGGRVRPLALDRHGLTLRVEHPDGDRDMRVNFPEPATDPRSLSRAFRTLVGCPFLNGLRARGR